MKRIVRLTENDLTRIVKRVIKEQATKIELEEYDKNYLLKLMTEANNILSEIFKRTYDEGYDEGDKIKYFINKMFNEFIKKITDMNYVIKLTPLDFRDIEDRLTNFNDLSIFDRSERLTTLSQKDIKTIINFINFLYNLSASPKANAKYPDNAIFWKTRFTNDFKKNLKEFLNKIKNVRVQSNMKSLPTKPLEQIPTNRETPERIMPKTKSPFDMSGLYGSK